MSRQQHIRQEEFPYLLTTVVRGRAEFFKEVQWAGELAEIIIRACTLHRFALLAYVIMPDHLHLIIYPNQAQASVPAQVVQMNRAGRDARARGGVDKLMHSIKSYFAHQVFELQPGTVFAWQPRFNSRVLNTSERLHTAVEYLRANAVRAGLEVRYTKDPYVYISKDIPI